MNPSHSKSCSCTSCVHQSESERPPVKRFIEDGSEIDKLYLGKYIPLRERKLLGKLVKTRAVYDEIRNELLSGSSTSEKVILRPKKAIPKEDDTTERSSAILELVDLVDRGEALGSRKSSECCSCCICSSDGRVHVHGATHKHNRDHKHNYHRSARTKHGHKRTHRGDDITESNINQRYRTRDTPRLTRFKAKHIRSVPCMCTSKLSGMAKHLSKVSLSKIKRPTKGIPVMDPDYMEFEEKSRKVSNLDNAKAVAKKSLGKIKDSKTRMVHGLDKGMRQSVKKIKKIEIKVKNSLQSKTKKSVENIKLKNMQMKEKMSDVKISIQSTQLPKTGAKKKVVEDVDDTGFKIKKDSITKFREKLKKKSNLDDWACELECDPEECQPEECYKILVQNRAHRTKRKDGIGKTRKRHQKSGKSSKESSVIVQAQEIVTDIKVGTKKKETDSIKLHVTDQTIKPKTKEKGSEILEHKGTKESPVVICECQKTKSVKSMTDVQPSTSKPALQTSSTGTVHERDHKSITKKPKSSRQSELRYRNSRPANEVKGKRKRHKDLRHIGRGPGSKAFEYHYDGQVSSSNFNIEKLKSKPAPTNLYPPTYDQRSKLHRDKEKRSNGYEVKAKHRVNQENPRIQLNKISKTKLKKNVEDSQAGGHTLKRCFCTLKLKQNKPKIKITTSGIKSTAPSKHLRDRKLQSIESIQTRVPYLKKAINIEPRECESGVCVPDECNPYECETRIISREVKRHSTDTTAPIQTLSTSSHTKSISSERSREMQTYPTSIKTHQRPSKMIDNSIINYYRPQSHKKAVRISSTFSFNIEFYKENHSSNSNDRNIYYKDYSSSTNQKPETLKLKHEKRGDQSKRKMIRDTGVDEKKHRLRHKRSQKSSSTNKSRHTLAKHKLKRCFCTLKLKSKNTKEKSHSSSKASMTFRQVIIQSPNTRQERQTMTDFKNQFRYRRPKLLPYECKPGICMPDECNPYTCLEKINRRNGIQAKRRNRTSNTENRQTRSASSLSSKAITPFKAKRVQSTMITYRPEIPVHKYNERQNISIKTIPKEIRTASSGPQRQAVRIGSSFSFDIEFYKNTTIPSNKNTTEKGSRMFHQTVSHHNTRNKLRNVKIQSSQGSQQISARVQVENRNKNARMGTVFRRCFCTLKLQNKKEGYKFIKEMATTGTKTPIFKQGPRLNLVTKGTETKQKKYKYDDKLFYACEPDVCVPGECDPYECVERIKRQSQLKQFGTGTRRIRMRPRSSLTSNSQISSGTGTENVRIKEQMTYVNTKKPFKDTFSPQNIKNAPEIFSAKSRQAVKIGSQFSFNVEFYKDRNQLILKDPIKFTKEKIASKYTEGNTKDISLSHQNSQVNVERKKPRSTGIKPILRRCFCTLSLRSKNAKNYVKPAIEKIATGKHKVYTVSRVTVAETNFTKKQFGYESKGLSPSIFNSYKNKTTGMTKRKKVDVNYNTKYIFKTSKSLLESKSSLINNVTYPRDNIDELNKSVLRLMPVNKVSNLKQSSQIINITSNFNYDIKCLKHFNNYMTYMNLVKTCSKSMMTKFPIRQPESTNVSVNQVRAMNMKPVFEKHYFSMNISTDAKGRRYKLKPYECEPGVCVPNECDPRECQKIIMKRLMRRTSKMSGTKTSSKLASSHTPRQSRAKNLQSNIQLSLAKTTHAGQPVGIRYTRGPTKAQKQAVRIGSNFSFNLELSKDKRSVEDEKYYTPPTIKYQTNIKPANAANRKTKATRGNRAVYNNHGSQSELPRVNRGSSTSPILKRCFCTLKLQKKRRQEYYKIHNASQSTMTPPINQKDFNAQRKNAGQDTKSHKIRNLDPNECEPNVCVSGECNPFECLERIKKRNKKYHHRKLETPSSASKSTSSDTGSTKIRGRHVQSDYQRRHTRGSTVQFQKSVKHSAPALRLQSIRGNRQAVKIGSTFSFSIEFYKDKRYPETGNIQAAAKAIKNRPLKQKKLKVHSSIIGSNPDLSSHSQESQAQIRYEHRSVSPKLKRCFCTLKFQKQDNKIKVLNRKVSQITRGTKARAYKVTPTLYTRSVMTKEKYSKLKPYECEPGICLPGECDPYDCEKVIQKGWKREQSIITERRQMRSVGSTSSSITRARRMQHIAVKHKKRHRSVQSRDISIKPAQQTMAINARQAVRLGSSFSFNIEFSKAGKGADKLGTVTNIPKVHYDGSPARKAKPIMFSAGTQDKKNMRSIESITNKSKNIRSTMTDLKRCFCTLSLKKQPKLVNKKKSKQNIKNKKISRKHESVSPFRTGTLTTKQIYRLEPYECEPYVCVPGECDPKKCLARIKQRQRKDLGTETRRPQSRFTSSLSSSTKAKRVQHESTNNDMKSIVVTKIPKRTISRSYHGESKQVVRIGSDFNFDIKFFKDTSYKPLTQQTSSPLKTQSEISRSQKKNQYEKNDRDIGSQAMKPKMQSTKTGITPLLKRCFCTLKFQKNPKVGKPVHSNLSSIRSDTKELKVIMPPKTDTVSRATRTKNHYKRTRKLESYECELGVCIPGECNPNECLERIRKRKKHSKISGTRRTRVQSISSTSSPSTKAQMTQSQNPKYKQQQTSHNEKYLIEEPRFKSFDNPLRQAVRISSSFSFNIELYKSGLPQPCHTPPCAVGDGFTKTKHKDLGIKSVKNIHRKVQSVDTKTDKGAGVTPLLKRCFCTLKLQNKQKQVNSSIKNSDVGTKTKDLKQPPPTIAAASKATHTSKKLKKQVRKLEHYECEPGICTPGECDPYVCLERIKKREMLCKTVGTHNRKGHSIGSVTSYSTKAQTCQAICPKQKQRPTNYNPRYFVEVPRFKSIDNPLRQAVRISSSLSFNIEFYKGGLPSITPCVKDNIYTKRKLKNSTCSQGTCLRNRKVQSNSSKVDDKSSGVGSTLKRCFCTLKLQKQGKNFADTKKIQTTKLKSNTETVNVGVGTKKKYKLAPYECEPGVCIPGQCDLNECIERIRKRKMIDTCTGPCLTTKSTATLTTQSKKCADTQCYKENSQCKNTQCFMKSPIQPSMNLQEKYSPYYSPSNSLNAQVVRFGSEFSCDIQFYKDQLPFLNTLTKFRENSRRRTSVTSTHQPKLSHEKTQSTGVRTEMKGTYKPLLKRCFCTSKLQKSPYVKRNETVNYATLHVTQAQNLKNKTMISESKMKYIPYNIHNSFQSKSPFHLHKHCNNLYRQTDKNPLRCPKTKKVQFDIIPVINNSQRKGFDSVKTKTVDSAFNSKNKYCKSKMCALKTDKKPNWLIQNSLSKFLKKCCCALNPFKKKATPVMMPKSNAFVEKCESDEIKRSNNKERDNFRSFNVKNKTMANSNEMITILPYRPKHFHNNDSKIVLGNNIKNIRSHLYKHQLQRKYGNKYDIDFPNKGEAPNTIIPNTNISIAKLYQNHKSGFKNIIYHIKHFFKISHESRNIVKSTAIFRCRSKLNISVTKGDILKASKSDRKSTNSKMVEIPKKSHSLKITRVSEQTKRQKKHVTSTEKEAKQFSRFQLGDGEQNQVKYYKKQPFNEKKCNRDFFCYYCHVLNDNKNDTITKIESPFYNQDKIVQLAVVSPQKDRTSNKKKLRYDGIDKISNKYQYHCDKKSCEKSLISKDNDYNTNEGFNDKCNKATCSPGLRFPKPGILKNGKKDKKGNIKIEENHIPGVKSNRKEKLIKKSKDKTTPDVSQICSKGIKPVVVKRCKKIYPCACCRDNKVQEFNTSHLHTLKDKEAKQLCDFSNKPCTCSGNISKDVTFNVLAKQNVPKQRKILSGHECYNKKTKPVVRCKTKKPCDCCSGNTGENSFPNLTTNSKNRRKNISNNTNMKCQETCETEEVDERNVIDKILDKVYEILPLKGPGPCDSCDYKPMLEMRMDAEDMAVLNKKELIEKIVDLKIKKGILRPDGTSPEELKFLHGKSCNCCICQSYKKPRAFQENQSALSSKLTTKYIIDKLFSNKKPCTCGSEVCAKENELMASVTKKKKPKPCVCGTKICATESLRVKMKDKTLSKSSGKMMKKELKKKLGDRKKEAEKAAKTEKARRNLIARQKRYQKEDAARRKKRRKDDIYMNAQVKKYKDASDCMLITESALDIGTFGIKTATGLLRGTGRAVLDPKTAYQSIKQAAQDPRRAVMNLSGAVSDSGAGSTLKRVKARIGATRFMYNLIKFLESYSVTCYLLHIFDRDAKARMKRKRRVRRRVPMDFECSLFMASLRKKPWLSVYYKCPWFYPHCISMLNIWQQFTDVMLFLLAVVVWSPLLLAMEVCRACMCCTLCTA